MKYNLEDEPKRLQDNETSSYKAKQKKVMHGMGPYNTKRSKKLGGFDGWITDRDVANIWYKERTGKMPVQMIR
jgi:hypothetical protein